MVGGVDKEAGFVKLEQDSLLQLNLLAETYLGVEPTENLAEQSPSRFEDVETHRGPYTSIAIIGSIAQLYSAVPTRSGQAGTWKPKPARGRSVYSVDFCPLATVTF